MKKNLLTNQKNAVDIIYDALQKVDKILIATHEHPDGDALGSSLALWHALKAQNKEVATYIPTPAPDFFEFLPAFAELTTTKPDTTTYDAIVVLDCTYLNRSHLEKEALEHDITINIDHHYDNPEQARFNLVVPQAAATAHILFEFFQATNIPITKDMATCLLTGIFTDTGSFMHDSTTSEILDIASYLMGKGARLSRIAHETYQKKDLPSLRIWGRALSRIHINEKTGASVSVITYTDLQECEATLDDLSGVVSMLNTLPNTKFAVLLVEHEPNKIKGSLRSEPHKEVDVSQIAKSLGGGGHRLASGFETEGKLMQENGIWSIVSPEGNIIKTF